MAPSNLSKKASLRKKQSRLIFDPVDDLPLSSSTPGQGLKPAKVRYSIPRTRRAMDFISSVSNAKDDEDSEDPLSAMTEEKPFRNSGLTQSQHTRSKRNMGVSGPPIPSASTKIGKRKAASKHIESSPEEEDEGASLAYSKAKKKASPEYVELSSEEDREGEAELPTLKASQVKRKPSLFDSASKPKAQGALIPDKKRIKRVVEDEDNDSEEPISSPRKRRIATVKALVIEDGTEDEEPITSPLKRARRPTGWGDSDGESPAKRRRPSKKVDLESEESDLESPRRDDEEDEDSDLLSSKRKSRRRLFSKPPKTPTRLARTKAQPKRHRTIKEKQMELLKRKRAGEKILEVTDSEIEDDEHQAIYDSDSDLRALSEFEDESEAEVVDKQQKRSTPRKKKTDHYEGDGEDLDAYDAEFVVDDDEMLGVPDDALLDIPLHLTQAAHKPLKEFFKDIVEWLIHNKLNPGFSRDDPVYLTAWRKLEDECKVIASSKFVSSQWTEEFTRAIYARPDYHERRLAPGEATDITGETRCYACNRSKHPATWGIVFKGTPYSKHNLEPIEHDSDENSDEESDAGTVNSKGEVLPDSDKEYMVGATCRSNANQAHTLIHWKKALHEWVLGSLTDQGYLTPAKLAEKESLSARKKTAYVNRIVDDWAASGTIKELWRLWKDQLETAKNAEQSKGGGRWGRG